MKELDKMTKEELKELIKKLEGEKTEEKTTNGTDNVKKELDVEEVKEKLEDILDGASCIICCTDKGILNMGYPKDMMNMLTRIAKNLKQAMPKDMIKFAVENGLCDDATEGFAHLMETILEKMQDKLGE